MPYFATSQEWLRQSSLLLEARPSTTRITTRYSISPGSKPPRKSKPSTSTSTEPTTTPKPPRGVLVLKTYDPASGTTLKYRTTKAAEVGRLVQALGRLGGRMAGLPPTADGEDVSMVDAPAAPAPVPVPGEGEGVGSGAGAGKGAEKGGQQQGGGGGGGGGKGKKKKGKR